MKTPPHTASLPHTARAVAGLQDPAGPATLRGAGLDPLELAIALLRHGCKKLDLRATATLLGGGLSRYDVRRMERSVDLKVAAVYDRDLDADDQERS